MTDEAYALRVENILRDRDGHDDRYFALRLDQTSLTLIRAQKAFDNAVALVHDLGISLVTEAFDEMADDLRQLGRLLSMVQLLVIITRAETEADKVVQEKYWDQRTKVKDEVQRPHPC